MDGLETKLLLISMSMVCIVGLSPSANGASDDIYCLESIKSSVEDPNSYLSSWDFTNKTEGFICMFVGVKCWHRDENKVLGLQLNDMGLRGNFPLGLEYCRSLTSLDLSGNQFSGSIPSDLCKRVEYVTLLNLSNNYFSGEIPANIGDCGYLNLIDVSNNKLRGEIPEGIGRMRRLRFLNVSGNELVGAVPPEFGVESYANNKALCGGPLGACKNESQLGIFMLGFGIGWVVYVVLYLVSFVVLEPPKRLLDNLVNYLSAALFSGRRL